MAVKTGLGISGNAFAHASLSKFFSGSEYSAPRQHIGVIKVLSFTILLLLWKMHINQNLLKNCIIILWYDWIYLTHIDQFKDSVAGNT